MGFSLPGRGASLATEHGLSAWAQQFRLDGLVAAPRMWSLPRPGVESVSPALTGGFLITGPPGKSLHMDSCLKRILEFCIIKDDIMYSIWAVVQMI